MKIAVGMSGGLDSTMTALLLKDRNTDVIGLTMRIWDGEPQPATSGKHGCYGPSEESDIMEAQAACSKIGIPHHVIDLTSEYSDLILKDFSSQYLQGRTPNPCVLCNPMMKFGAMLRRARADGFDFSHFATGHYARVNHDVHRDRYVLKKGIDPAKDQSYFLYRLNQAQLSQVIFPLGEYLKKDIRTLAVERGFSDFAYKSESQNFMDGGDYRSLINDEDRQPGLIIDLHGNVLGEHQGIDLYTIGQRKRLNLGGQAQPLYVIKKIADSHTIVVGRKENLTFSKFTVSNINWISVDKITQPIRLNAKFRYSQTAAPCTVHPANENEVMLKFDDAHLAATPGQSAVFYQDDEVVGGGVIGSVEYEDLEISVQSLN